MPSILYQALGVVRDFDDFGGASAELVSWELGIDPHLVHASWSRAIDQGLLAPAPQDQIFGEAMWRLTAAGRRRLDGGPPASRLDGPPASRLDGQPAVVSHAGEPTRFVARPTVRRTRPRESPRSLGPQAPLRLSH